MRTHTRSSTRARMPYSLLDQPSKASASCYRHTLPLFHWLVDPAHHRLPSAPLVLYSSHCEKRGDRVMKTARERFSLSPYPNLALQAAAPSPASAPRHLPMLTITQLEPRSHRDAIPLATPVTTSCHHRSLSNRMEFKISFTNSITSCTSTP
jgi:hypothetical protein